MSEPLRVVKRLSKKIPVSILYAKDIQEGDEVYKLIKSFLESQTRRNMSIEKKVSKYRGYIRYDSFDAGGSLTL